MILIDGNINLILIICGRQQKMTIKIFLKHSNWSNFEIKVNHSSFSLGMPVKHKTIYQLKFNWIWFLNEIFAGFLKSFGQEKTNKLKYYATHEQLVTFKWRRRITIWAWHCSIGKRVLYHQFSFPSIAFLWFKFKHNGNAWIFRWRKY